MKITKIKKALVLVTIASGVLAVGCELIVDFDRTKIPVELTEASIPDGAIPSEASTLTPDGGASDAAPDAIEDATSTTDATDAPVDG